MFNRLLHKYLRLPYRLNVRRDTLAGNKTVVLLHGIAATGDVWSPIVDKLGGDYRLVVLDLLGFGDSPKPEFVDYTADDHAKAVHHTLKKLRVSRCYLVGHSMGAIVALHLASVYPKAIDGVLCVGMPAYDADKKQKALTQYRTNAYVRLYTTLITHPALTLSAAEAIIRRFGSKVGIALDKSSILSFQRSLKNTIITQKVLAQLGTVSVPTVVLYGSLDPFIIQLYYAKPPRYNSKVTYRKVLSTHALDAKLSGAVIEQIRQF